MNQSTDMRFVMTLRRWVCVAPAASVMLWAATVVEACPFCNAAMQTLSQEMESADVALIAELVEPIPTTLPDSAGVDGSPVPAAKFRVLGVLRGAEQLEGKKQIDVVYFGDEAPDRRFLITGLAGVTGPGLDWTTPVPLSSAAVDYVKALLSLPAEGTDRLAFFQDYLEHDDPLLAQDAYDEFARTPYAVVTALGPRMEREKILRWIADPGVGPSSRRLYLTLLGVCGKPDDVHMLEQLMNYDHAAMRPGVAAVMAASSVAAPAAGPGLLDKMFEIEESRKRESLDALLACYLKLKGPAGLELVNELFFANPKVQYRYLHSAIMALRFHGEETDVIPRDKLLESMRLALDHRDFADQVIPDLTRWEDWEVMPRLVAMFKDSPADDWIRQPVASYLLVAAEQSGDVGRQAQEALAELESIDKATIDRAKNNMAFNFLSRTVAAPTADGGGEAATTSDAATGDSDDAADATSSTADPDRAAEDSAEEAPESPQPPAESEPTVDQDNAGAQAPATGTTDQVAAAASTAGAAPAPVAAARLSPPSKIKIIAVPLIAAAVLLAIFAVLLRGADPRSSEDNP